MVGGAMTQKPVAARGRSIGYLLLTLVVSIFVPLIGLFSWQAVQAAREQRVIIEAKRTEIASLVSQRIDSEIERYFGVLQGLASLLDSTDATRPTLEDVRARLTSDVNIANVWSISDAGSVSEICKGSRDCRVDEQLIAKVLKGTPDVTGVWEASPGDARILLASPPRVGSSRRAALAMELRVYFFSRAAFDNIELGPGWLVGVVDRTNRLVARSLRPERHLGGVAGPGLAAVAAGAESDGTFENVTLEGVEMINSFHRSRLTNWTTVAAAPRSVLESPLKASLILVLSVSGAILALTTALAFRQVRRIVEPVRDLSRYAIALSTGRPFIGGRYQIAEFDAVKSTMENTLSSTARLAAVAATSGDAILSVSTDGTVLSWNPAAEDMFGYTQEEMIGRSKLTLAPPDRHHELETERIRALQGDSFSFETLRRHRDGALINVSITSAPIYAPTGDVIAISSILRDIGQRKADERHILDLMRELAHRSKNQIAIIQSIAKKTAASAESLEEFSEHFASRLQGLAITFDVLSKRDWKDANVRDLVSQQLGVFIDGRSFQLRVDGPEVELDSSYIEALGLALHELATNAVKHGAWSNSTGIVHVNWSSAPAKGTGSPKARDFELVWREEGGPAVVSPEIAGFGSVILDTVVARSVRGVSKIEYPKEGVRWTVAFQLGPN